MRFQRSLVLVALNISLASFMAVADHPEARTVEDIYLNDQGTGDFATIQEAIDAVAGGGTIHLQDGTYTGPGNVNLIFPDKSLTLTSISENPEACTIDCEATPPPGSGSGDRGPIEGSRGGPEAVRAFFFAEPGSPVYIRGIRVLNGFAPDGGAVFISNSSPTFDNCRFEMNTGGSEGGAIWMSNASPAFNDCVFENNHVTGYGGAVQIYDMGSQPLFQSCRFSRNTADWSGAIDLFNSGGADIERSIFWDNEATELGGAITDWDPGNLQISYSTFAENEADEGGHIYFGPDAEADLTATTFVFAPRGGALRLEFGLARESFSFSCCDVFGNTEGDWDGTFAVFEGTEGNFSADPQFCGEIGTGDFHLESDSPCAPENSGGCGLIGAEPVNCEDTPTATTSWSHVKGLF